MLLAKLKLHFEAPDLRQLPGDRSGLDADPVAHGFTDPVGKARFELGRGRRERLDLRSGPLESGLDVAGLRFSIGRLGEPLAGAIEGAFVHECDDSVSAG